MALIKCPECENEISDKAETCPKCGCPISKSDDTVSSNQSSTYVYKKKILIVSIIILVIIIAIITSIIIYDNNKKPSNMSDEMYSIGTSAIKVIDDYIDNNIDYETAYRKLDGLYDQAERQSEEDEKDRYSPIVAYLNSLGFKLLSENEGFSNYSELLEARNKLAEDLNLSKR